MKTQIITLESYDDLISVRDRMSWAKTPRILLVWPKFEKVALRQVDLKVLQRHASSLGAQLGLVTRSRRVRDDAEALRIPVFESAGQAQRVAWPQPRPTGTRWAQRPPRKDLREQRDQLPAESEAWRAHPVVRVGAFMIGVASVLLLVSVFIPRLQVTLHPESQIQSLVLPVIASPSIDAVFITGSIPAYEKRMVVDGTRTVIVTGEGMTPKSNAKGVVVFRNLTTKAVTIPAGTMVRTAEHIRFATTREGEVEAGVGKTIELPVEAVTGGLAGNVAAETILIVDGRLAVSLTVTNPDALTGGREVPSVQASDADRERVKNELMESLEREARAQFADELAAGDIVFEDTLADSQILSEEYDPAPGAASRNLTLTMQVEFSVLYAAASDVTELASLALNASLPPDFRAAAGAKTISIKPVDSPSSRDDGSSRWTIRAERRIVHQVNTAQVTQMILGVDPDRVQTMLKKNLPLDGDPEVRLSPAWWPWAPIVPFRISVVSEYE